MNAKIARELVKIARELVGKRFRRVDERLVYQIVEEVVSEEPVEVKGEFGVWANISGSYYPGSYYEPPEYPDVEAAPDGWKKKPYVDTKLTSFKKFMLIVAKSYAVLHGKPENMDIAQFAEMDLLRKATIKALKRGVPTYGYFGWEVTDGNMHGGGEVPLEELNGEVMVYGKVSGNTIKWIPKVKTSLDDMVETIDGGDLEPPDDDGPEYDKDDDYDRYVDDDRW